ncbi:PIN-like domain-containing protein [Massilia sp. CCM 9210]|uniref:PIN-like domain-containing protein n=1 Tax=Massilia scottii TaxID=3057166 RepID=UPI002796D789|nr:PIN-like domain-containing protein [Massilia sp. CCM 9210]MDQ1815486.1 PIN-like domain-containing protein [Massilia sp. CCM 9210]
MRAKFSGWHPKKPDEISKIWDEAIFIPDTNVLLHCLRHSTVVRDELLRLFEVLGDALWIPYQVGLEFHRNRLGVEFGAVDAYDTLIKDQEAFVEKARDRLRQLRAHPTINVLKELSALDMFLSDFKARMETARLAHPSSEIDSVIERLTNLFERRVGDKWSSDKLAALRKEGEDRYAKKIPPGYKDSKKDAGEFDKFGDLIIWKEMMMKAKTDKRSVIFISDDAKEDWWWIHRGRKMGPRPELIEEFHAEAQQAFHMYEFSQFLRFAAKRFPEINANVERVEKSLLADEQARRYQNNTTAAIERNAQLRALEDERDHIVNILSGAPGSATNISVDRSTLRVRLDELNKEIRSIGDIAGRDVGAGDGESSVL